MKMKQVKIKKKEQSFHPQVSGLLDYIAPSVLKFEQKSVIMGNLYACTLVITDYPTEVDAAWLSDIVTMPGVTASIHIQPTDPYALINSIKIAAGTYQSRLNAGGNAIQMSRAEKGYKDSMTLLKKIDEEQQQVSYICVILLITGRDKEQLQERIKRVQARLASKGMRGRVPMLKQEEGLRMVAPWGFMEQDIFNLGARNMPSESIAAAYPFVYSGLNDGEGILLGQDKTGGIVLVDFWKREGDRTNSNVTIMGRPGVGKSATVKKKIIDSLAQGVKVIVIDPEREYKELCENVGGNWVDCGGGIKGRINPLEIRPVPLDDEDEEDNLYEEVSVDTKGPLALHIQTLRIFFKLYLRDLTKKHLVHLEMALEELYADFNITWKTDPRTLTPKDYPNIYHLYEKCKQKYEETKLDVWEDLTLGLRSAAVGADASLWAGPSTIDSNSNLTVLDIHNLLEGDEDVQKAQFFNCLSWSWSQVALDRNEKIEIYVDEAYLLADPDIPHPLKYLRNTSKRIRKYEGALIVIFHNLIDFLDPSIRRYGQALIDNPTYKIIMGQGEKDIEALTSLMSLSEKEISTLQEGKRGDALFFAGSKRLQIQIELHPHELELMGSGGGR